MALEIEQKYRLKNPASMRKILLSLGARRIHSGYESNELFDQAGILRAALSVLRLRRFGKGQKGLLTFKGPRLRGGLYKRRVEIETPVQWAKTRALLRASGFSVAARYTKMREEFLTGKTSVTLDFLGKKGWFLEIEGASSDIARLEKSLGLSPGDREDRTYLEILKVSYPSA